MAYRARSALAQSLCAGCDEPIADRATLTLADHSIVHFEDIDCLLVYGKRWRRAAAAGLRVLGLDPPPGFEPVPGRADEALMAVSLYLRGVGQV
jgi:hypothetical protein